MLKDVKVKMPLSYHTKLHTVKLITGRPMSDLMMEALDDYFAKVRAAAHRDA